MGSQGASWNYMHWFTNVLFLGHLHQLEPTWFCNPSHVVIDVFFCWKDLKVPSIIALAGDDHIVWDPGCEDRFLVIRSGYSDDD